MIRAVTVVALRKESVDRNYPPGPPSFLYGVVALRKESVDRNRVVALAAWAALGSLSARRAWIEMPQGPAPLRSGPSLSARRAWIEINVLHFPPAHGDRRSPQGERG